MRKVLFISTVVLVLLGALMFGCSKEMVDESSTDVEMENGETAGQAMAKLPIQRSSPTLEPKIQDTPCKQYCTNSLGERFCCQY